MANDHLPRLPRRQIARIALRAGVDYDTVRRSLAGRTRPLPLTRAAIDKALAAEGLPPLPHDDGADR